MARYFRYRRVSADELRKMFNDRNFVRQAEQGHLHTRVVEDKHPSSPLAGEPFCTKSQLIAYYDRNNHEVARAHQYLRPNQTIGLSGKPDPKRICIADDIYVLEASE